MSDAFIHWYTGTWSPAVAERMVDVLGLALANPAVAIGIDDEGLPARVPISRDEAVRRLGLADDDEFEVQLWLNPEADVYCRARRVAGKLVVCEFDLDGKSTAERQEVVAAVARWCREHLDSTVGIVVDLTGASLEADWDALVQGTPSAIPAMPTALAIQRSAAAVLPDNLARRTTASLIVIDPADLLAL